MREARDLIINGKKDWTDLVHEKVGEIKAQIIERDGQVWMVKECAIHGKYEDLMAIDAKFLEWIEKNFPGRDIPAHNDEILHRHGSSTVRHGRGSVLTVDLTNRCNMMCDPCFMDANQVGYVHEPVSYTHLWAAKLDGEVGDAFSRVEDVGRGEGLCGTRVEAKSAVAAEIGGGKFGWRDRRLEFESGDDGPEKQPRAKVFVDEAGIFREPAEAGVFGGDALKDWSGVCLLYTSRI